MLVTLGSERVKKAQTSERECFSTAAHEVILQSSLLLHLSTFKSRRALLTITTPRDGKILGLSESFKVGGYFAIFYYRIRGISQQSSKPKTRSSRRWCFSPAAGYF